MIRGDKVGLRTRQDSDVPVFQAELYNDVATRARADVAPWRPLPPDAEGSPAAAEHSERNALFSVVELESQELAGDVVRVLCEYGFAVRGLQRLQLETLADNAPMIAAATGAGFTVEGTLRRSAWVYGAFVDEVVLGLLAEEWAP